MDFANPQPSESPFEPSALMRWPLGAVSPLWGLYLGAAAGGAAFWWMSQWARPQNLESFFGAASRPLAEPEILTSEVAEPTPAAEAAPVPVAEASEAVTTAAAVPEMAERLVDAALPDVAVGGEAAPVSAAAVEGALSAAAEETADPEPQPQPSPKGRPRPNLDAKSH